MEGYWRGFLCVGMAIVLLMVAGCGTSSESASIAGNDDTARIQPAVANARYWQYDGKPVLLLGGSREDNLFNHPEGLAEHLDLLAASGGNYIRNTLSSRNPGNVWAFKRLENGLYDLNAWDEEY